jgi:PhnB protein
MNPADAPRRPLTEAELQVALALLEGPAHGYRLMQRAAEIGSAPRLGAATMYRTLRRMLDDGLAAPEQLPAGEDERRRPYRLTGEGLRAVAAEGHRMAALIGAAVARGVPDRFHTITPQLVVRDADAAIGFYCQAFGARLLARHAHESGRVQHAELSLGDSLLLLHDDFSDLGGPAAPRPGQSGVTIHLYVPDADAVFQQALDAGATSLIPVASQPWGDRYGILQDPYDHRWSIGTSQQ